MVPLGSHEMIEAFAPSRIACWIADVSRSGRGGLVALGGGPVDRHERDRQEQEVQPREHAERHQPANPAAVNGLRVIGELAVGLVLHLSDDRS
jgi:hypothetical protein